MRPGCIASTQLPGRDRSQGCFVLNMQHQHISGLEQHGTLVAFHNLSGILCRRDRSLAFTVRAGWNDFEWSKAKIVEHEKAAEGVSPHLASFTPHGIMIPPLEQHI